MTAPRRGGRLFGGRLGASRLFGGRCRAGSGGADAAHTPPAVFHQCQRRAQSFGRMDNSPLAFLVKASVLKADDSRNKHVKYDSFDARTLYRAKEVCIVVDVLDLCRAR